MAINVGWQSNGSSPARISQDEEGVAELGVHQRVSPLIAGPARDRGPDGTMSPLDPVNELVFVQHFACGGAKQASADFFQKKAV